MATKSQTLRKDEILKNLVETRQNILAELSQLSEGQSDQIFLGIWSVKDLLAHFIGWDETNRRAVKSILKGQVPSFYEHRDREWQTYNAMLVKKYRKGSGQELLATSRESQEKLIKFLKTIPAEYFSKDFGVRFRGYRITIARLLEAELQDEQTHLKQVTDFFGKEP